MGVVARRVCSSTINLSRALGNLRYIVLFNGSGTYDELVNIARRYTKKWRDVVDILDKNLQGRDFIVIDLTRAKEDPLYIRKGWDQPLDLSNE